MVTSRPLPPRRLPTPSLQTGRVETGSALLVSRRGLEFSHALGITEVSGTSGQYAQPSGHEARGQRVWLDYVKPFADETYTDAYGNAVAVLNKGGSPRLMLAAHADEISMVVNLLMSRASSTFRNWAGWTPPSPRPSAWSFMPGAGRSKASSAMSRPI